MTKTLLLSVTKKDCDFKYYRGSGKGGQARNKTENCCRVTHRASGATAYSEDGRSKEHNTKDAWLKMINTEVFQKWHKAEVMRASGAMALIEQKVDRQVQEAVVEAKDAEGRWVDWDKRKPDDDPG